MLEKDIQFIIDNLHNLCTNETFVGIGSTRKVFRYKNFVIKKHLHPIGFKQSKNEYNIFTKLNRKDLTNYIAEIVYVDEQISIQKYYSNLSLIDAQSYDLEISKDTRFTKELRDAIQLIDMEYDGFDLKDSGNYGLNENGYFVLIDYGMTKALYEKEWVPLAEVGILPQIYYEKCMVCGNEKELRIYGDTDLDRRCFACGKE
ncbi:protein kinase [Psychrobacillus sp. NPDC058041]|uniref:protein kinase n=1 Tax=Psychrobacillus sp. NPDC058041 TaxID=3346310 RepID=UPI0036D8DF70